MLNKQVATFSAKYGWIPSSLLIALALAPFGIDAYKEDQIASGIKREAQQETARLHAGNESLEALSVVARERIERGCISPVLEGVPVMVRPGVRVRDGASGRPVAPGLVFCDQHGGTAISDETGHLVDFAPLNSAPPSTTQNEALENVH